MKALENPMVQFIVGALAALGCYTLSGTILKGTSVEKEVAMLGTGIASWLIFRRPGDQKVEVSK